MNTKTIVITGGTKGIGFGLALEFARKGHKVLINGRSKESLDHALHKLKEINKSIVGIQGSVDQESTYNSIIKECVLKFGGIDIWINNAGIPQPSKQFTSISSITTKQIFDINIFGSILGTQLATRFMIDQSYGKIFNMEGFGSDGRTMDNLSLYGTTKRAINYFTKSAAKEVKKENVQIGVISPGMVRTDFLKSSFTTLEGKELKQFKKVYKILAEDIETVCPFIANRILKSTKNYDRIEFLTKGKLMVKIFKLMVS